MFDKLLNEPIILNKNRVRRAYTGGKLLDEWQGIKPAADGNYPEEFLISTVEVTNPDKKPGEGLSKTTLDTGAEVSLKEIISSNPEGFLGKEYCSRYGREIGVLARVGDSKVRLVIQAHPDAYCAKNYLNYPRGKTEAWYIIECRQQAVEKPHIFAGFKPGITRKRWEELFEKQDIQGMLDSMHKLYVKKGDVILIEAGMPHAMGPGSLFLEIHEPSDYTLRLERSYLTDKVFSDEEIHYGMGFQRLFDCFDYKTYTKEEIHKKVFISSSVVKETDNVRELDLLTYEHTSCFRIKSLKITGRHCLENYNGHRIAIVIRGSGSIEYGTKTKDIKQGQGIFLPAGLKSPLLRSNIGEMEIIIGYPPKF